MDSWEWNKIAGAVLGTLIFVMVVGIFSDAVYSVPEPAKPGYVVEGVETASAGGEQAAAPKEEPLPDFAKAIPAADVKQGEKVAQRCAQCHDWAKGGPNKIGPNLWNILGSPRGEDRGGYDFSAAMKAKGGTWTYAELYRFLKAPQVYIPGTKMTFAGLKSEKQRLEVIAYIRTWADSPQPLPPPAAAQPPENDKKATAPTDKDGAPKK